MIKLDKRRRRKPKKDEEDEQERTEVDFSQDLIASTLKAPDQNEKGKLGQYFTS